MTQLIGNERQCSAMSYEDKVTLPDGEMVTLRFKDFAKIPGKISLYNRGDSEAQLWGSLEWGLIEPANWPRDSKSSAVNVFAEVAMEDIMKVHRNWQQNAGVTLGESPASSPSSENMEKS